MVFVVYKCAKVYGSEPSALGYLEDHDDVISNVRRLSEGDRMHYYWFEGVEKYSEED